MSEEKKVPKPSVVGSIRTVAVMFGGPIFVIGASMAAATAGLLIKPQNKALRRVVRSLSLAGVTFPWVYEFALSPLQRYWGATDLEIRGPLPGDELINHPLYETTHAVTIHAPVSDVWPWLVQFGYGKAGFYSYDLLENLAGLDIHSADEILPELQELKIGDQVLVAPGYGFKVIELEPESLLILRSMDPATGQITNAAAATTAGPTLDATWAFILNKIDNAGTRLIARYRADGAPRWLMGTINHYLLETPHSVMEIKMLQGIKKRAEGMTKRGL